MPPTHIARTPPYRKGAADHAAGDSKGSTARGDWLVVLAIFALLASLARWTGVLDRMVEAIMGFAPRW